MQFRQRALGYSKAGSACRVHSGFHAAYSANGVHRNLLAFVTQLLAPGSCSQHASVLLTGHSLGGAIACLLAFDLVQRTPLMSHRVTVYTFGCPRIGNHAFARVRPMLSLAAASPL